VTKNSLKVENIPSVSNVVHRKRMTKGMETESYASDVKARTEQLEIAENIPLTELRPGAR